MIQRQQHTTMRILAYLIGLLLPNIVLAQGLTPGLRLGASYGRMDGTAQTIIRDEWYPEGSYATSERFRWRALIGGYLDIQPTNVKWLRIEASVDYEHAWGPSKNDPMEFDRARNHDFEYVDWFNGNTANSADSLQYRLWFNYSYVNIGLVTNLYFIGSDEFRLGPSFGFNVGFNVTPKDVTYRSNHPDLGPDLQIQENISNVLKGKTATWLIGGMGAQMGNLDLFARYRFGLNDLVITGANSYNFIDNKNSAQVSWFFGAGYRFKKPDSPIRAR